MAAFWIFIFIIAFAVAILIWSKTDTGKNGSCNFFPSPINIASRLVRTSRDACFSRRALGARFSRSLRMLILLYGNNIRAEAEPAIAGCRIPGYVAARICDPHARPCAP